MLELKLNSSNRTSFYPHDLVHRWRDSQDHVVKNQVSNASLRAVFSP